MGGTVRIHPADIPHQQFLHVLILWHKRQRTRYSERIDRPLAELDVFFCGRGGRSTSEKQVKGEKTALKASSRPQKTSALTESNVHSLLTPATMILYETTTGEFGFQNFKPSTERPITLVPLPSSLSAFSGYYCVNRTTSSAVQRRIKTLGGKEESTETCAVEVRKSTIQMYPSPFLPPSISHPAKLRK